jgi:toxin CcdB
MSDFKVYQNLSITSEDYPFLLDVQSELLVTLDTRLVIPLIRREGIGKITIKNLNPTVEIAGSEYVVLTQQMAAIPKGILGKEVVNVSFSRSAILSSVDFLITGF